MAMVDASIGVRVVLVNGDGGCEYRCASSTKNSDGGCEYRCASSN